MEDALLLGRLQFAFTITFHYIYPQLTMGLALLIVVFKVLALKRNDEHLNTTARFWGKIFGISFLFGVITGIPMEFQFGTNWALFSTFAGGVIGQTLAMEGIFAFFLESTFLGIFLYGEKRFGQKVHLASAILVFLGAWLSAYFIVATNAWMQHPVAYTIATDGSVHLNDFFGLLFNPWLLWQYTHTMCASMVTASFVVVAVGAYYLLKNHYTEYGKTFLRYGLIAATISSILVVVPTGDGQVKEVYRHKTSQFSAMEGVFHTKEGADFVIIGIPNVDSMRVDYKISIPYVLSLMTHLDPKAPIKGLNDFPREHWPAHVELVFYSYRAMILLGILFVSLTLVSLFLWWKKKLFTERWLLRILTLSFPLPYLANTAGWMTAEIGRQPWLVYGLMLTKDGLSPFVSPQQSLFSLIGFVSLYTLFGILYIILIIKKVRKGPEVDSTHVYS
ncbi:MAG: cytochrome ubiquinol oxidase subunit I [Bacteroidetes bacterium]|nr:cytochrome ubiquinol oxidase subunit I [Bacteroidota bacterium]